MNNSFAITVFTDLTNKYSSWPELKSYLESDHGGAFQIVDTNDEKGLCIIRYEKGTTNMELPHSRWFRSVVWNTVTNCPVCIAPPKANMEELPYNTFKELLDADVVCQEFLDGFMINCFYTVTDDKWHICSRSKLDATGKFYSQKAFRELFMEAYRATTEEVINELDASVFVCKPDKTIGESTVFYSFLVQHVENRIVKNITNNRVYLIHRGTVYEDGRVVLENDPAVFAGKQNITSITIGSTPATTTWANVLLKNSSSETESNSGFGAEQNEVQKWLRSYMALKMWEFQGIVFKDNKGNRWRVRNENYSVVRSLRGNTPSVRDRFCQLYPQNLVLKYLEYYPEDTVWMSLYLVMIATLVNILYTNYLYLHVNKTVTIKNIDKMYHPHLYSIHGIYLTHLRPNNKNITKDEIQLYLRKLPWQRMTFLLKKISTQLQVLEQ